MYHFILYIEYIKLCNLLRFIEYSSIVAFSNLSFPFAVVVPGQVIGIALLSQVG